MASIPLISCQNLSKGFGVHPLFTELSLTLTEGERIGLIGPNGAGKSTLMRLFAGVDSADEGEIARRRGLHIVYRPQEDQFGAADTVASVLAAALPSTASELELQERMKRILPVEKLPPDAQPVAELSGGWRKRLALSTALLQEPELLLLDEPTNHLDLEGILWLEGQLEQRSGSVVMISHDRGVLETSCNRIIELNRCYRAGFLSAEGGYSNFLELRYAYLHQQSVEEQRLANIVRREVDWLRRGPAARTTKSRSRIDKAMQLQEDLRGVRQRNRSQASAEIEFDATGRRTRLLVHGEDLSLSRAGRSLFTGLELRLGGGQCLGILGPNGSGKSSLLQMLCGELKAAAGRLKLADNLRIVLFDQKREQLDLSQTLRQALAEHGDQVIFQDQPIHVAAWAKRFLFQTEQLNQPLHTLSGGEQARVLIANLMCRPADLLLLDEPTNDLDLATLQILEESLSEFAGAILLISHDRYFMNRLCDQLLSLEEGKSVYYEDLSQWLAAQQRRQSASSLQIAAAVVSPALTESRASKGLSHDERKEWKKMEDKIARAETALGEAEKSLHDPDIASNAAELLRCSAAYAAARASVDSLYARWAELEERGGK